MNNLIKKIGHLSFRLPKEWEGLDGKNRAVMLDDVVSILEEYERKQPQADKWIPCEERLPELDEGMECFKQSKEYLVTVQWWDEETNVDIGWYNQNGMWSNDSKICKVIAWQSRPLPQPYKKEGAEHESS